MIHLPPLIHDLALILATGAFATILFKWLKQPVVLGYLVAGFLVGPHFHWTPDVTDPEGVKVWAEAGVIFLLFGLGLEFSFKKLLKVGTPATVTAFVEVIFMLGIGYAVGQLLGWPNMDSLFLGGILSISSTTIIIRAFDELGLKHRGFASLVFGVLIVEDLIAILLLVMLSTVAVSRAVEGVELAVSFGKLAFFLTLWFVGGIFLVPSFLRRVRGHLSAETTVILAIGLCLGMVILATAAGFSPALGAFIMGSILAETREAERIEHLTKPVQDLFGAVFFVSVGMLIDPKYLVEYGGPIALIAVLTVLGKVFSTTVGALISGRSLRHSLQTGMSLAQIGEFSFIIATLGLTLKVTSPSLYPIAVAVSAITTFTTPYLIRFADPLVGWVERKLPSGFHERLHKYQTSFVSASEVPEWRRRLRSYLVRLMLNGVVVVAAFLAIERVLPTFTETLNLDREWLSWTSAAVGVLVTAPFLWAMAIGGAGAKGEDERKALSTARDPLYAIEMLRIVVTSLLIAVLVGRLTNGLVGFTVATLVMTGLFFVLSRRLQTSYQWIEKKFLGNLEERERPGTERAHLAPWDAHLVEITVEPNSPCVGKSLAELAIRETYGVSIALIDRGQKRISAPGRSDFLFPGDKVSVIGTDEQIQKFAFNLRETYDSFSDQPDKAELRRVVLHEGRPEIGKAIRTSGIRERYRGLVVGIERDGKRILNPDSTLVLNTGDILWVVGDTSALQGFHGKQ